MESRNRLHKMTSSKYWQPLVCALLLVNADPSRVCRAACWQQIASDEGIAPYEVGGAAASEWDAGNPLSRNLIDGVEAKIVWELPPTRHAEESVVGGINASVAAEELARWNIGGNGDVNYVSNRTGYHPGTRVIVDVEASGTNRTRIGKFPRSRHYLAEFRNLGYWPYRICFESSARKVQSKGGDTWMQVRINKRGRVVAANLMKSSVDHPQIAACILNATRLIRLSGTQSTGAILNLRVRVFSGDAPLFANRILPDGKVVVEPGLLRVASNGIKGAVAQCVGAGLGRDPGLWGRLAVLLQFNRDGQVVRSDEYDSHFPDATVVECVNRAYRKLRIAPQTEPTIAVVALRIGTLPRFVGESNTELHSPTGAPLDLSKH
jgi:hypothetical protein